MEGVTFVKGKAKHQIRDNVDSHKALGWPEMGGNNGSCQGMYRDTCILGASWQILIWWVPLFHCFPVTVLIVFILQHIALYLFACEKYTLHPGFEGHGNTFSQIHSKETKKQAQRKQLLKYCVLEKMCYKIKALGAGNSLHTLCYSVFLLPLEVRAWAVVAGCTGKMAPVEEIGERQVFFLKTSCHTSAKGKSPKETVAGSERGSKRTREKMCLQHYPNLLGSGLSWVAVGSCNDSL